MVAVEAAVMAAIDKAVVGLPVAMAGFACNVVVIGAATVAVAVVAVAAVEMA